MGYLREKIMLVALTLLSYAPATAQPVALPGSEIPQFVDPLPLLAVAGGTIETITSASATLSMCEFKANVMPSTFVPAASSLAYSGTYVWGYRNGSTCPGSGTPFPTYFGPVFVATRGTPTEIQYINSLPNTAASQLSAWKTSTDQTLHWADPLNHEANRCADAVTENQSPVGACASNYAGPVPTVPICTEGRCRRCWMEIRTPGLQVMELTMGIRSTAKPVRVRMRRFTAIRIGKKPRLSGFTTMPWASHA